MATAAEGSTRFSTRSAVTRLLTTIALVSMYLFGTLATSTLAVTLGASSAEARGRRGRRGRRGWRGRRGRRGHWRGRRGRRGYWRGRRGRRGRWGRRGFCFYFHGAGFCT